MTTKRTAVSRTQPFHFTTSIYICINISLFIFAYSILHYFFILVLLRSGSCVKRDNWIVDNVFISSEKVPKWSHQHQIRDKHFSKRKCYLQWQIGTLGNLCICILYPLPDNPGYRRVLIGIWNWYLEPLRYIRIN